MGISQKLSSLKWLVLIITLFSSQVIAAVESRYDIKPEFQSQSTSPLRTEIYVESTSFLSSNKGEFRKSSHQQLNKFGINAKGHDKDFLFGELNFAGEWFYSPVEDFHYVNLVNLNWQKSMGSSRLIVGRSLHDWSAADQTWMNSLWQPTFSWSKLRPEQNGLIGLHLKSHLTTKWQVYSFASPVYLPSLGARHRLVDGDFQAANPWFAPPAKSVNLPFKSNADIFYETDIPPINEVIFRPSFAMQVSWEDQQPFCRLAYAYKPMNYVYQSVDVSIRYDLPSSAPGVNVVPRFPNHHLVTGECGLKKLSGWQTWLSLTEEHPENLQDTLDNEWTFKRTKKATILASEVSYDFDKNKYGRYQIYLGYQKIWGGDIGDGGEFGDEKSSLFERRFEYYDAVKVGYRNRSLNLGPWPLASSFELIYDDLQKGMALVSSMNLFVQPHLSFSLKADFLALAAGSNPQIERGFVDIYKANDEMSLGVNYVF